MRLLSNLAIIVVIAAVAVGGAALAIAGGGGKQANAGLTQYDQKPGCGPDKTDGVAGGSGQHTGQPPKEPERKDCPEPPGQQKKP